MSILRHVNDIGLRFPNGDIVDPDELCAIFDALPVAGARFVQHAGATSLELTPTDGTSAETALSWVTPIVHAEFPDATIEIVPGLTEVTVDAVAPTVVRGLWSPSAPPSASHTTNVGDVWLGSNDRSALESVAACLRARDAGQPFDAERLREITLQGLQPECATRLLWATDGDGPLAIDGVRCTGCGDCMTLCPTDALVLDGDALTLTAERCVECHLCSEHCTTGAIRPVDGPGARVAGPTLMRLFARADAEAESTPYLASPTNRPRPASAQPTPESERMRRVREIPKGNSLARSPIGGPRVVLGLATVTLMEHAAAVLIDGELVAAIEEERLVRERHYRFKADGRPGASLASDPTLRIDDAWPKRAVDTVLKMAGLSLEDVDAIGLNGMPYRMRHAYSSQDPAFPPNVHRAGRIVFVPHHLAHAASVYGMTDWDDAWILTVDGHGDYETLSWYRATGDDIALIEAVPFFPDRSVGGVFDTITQFLGFGSHGQGSTMALAAMGSPTIDFSDAIRLDDTGNVRLSEWHALQTWTHLRRDREDEITKSHRDLAASLQHALESTVGGFLRRRMADAPDLPLGIAGGVGLSCRMNGHLRRTFAFSDMAVPPGANDAGTAIGAALVADRELTGRLPRIEPHHSHWGPSWSDDGIARQLTRMKVPHQRVPDIADAVAERLADGQIVCWFQGRMEFGPRALGGRSILADPRNVGLKDRLNRMKSRQTWRPFGPSILAGHQADWFEDSWDSRFMLFAVQVRGEKQSLIPVVVHDDGSTRPQCVHEDATPRYHATISAFHQRTGVPMVVNTSFNTGGEPIVMTPRDAVKSFLKLGADWLAIGDCLVRSRR